MAERIDSYFFEAVEDERMLRQHGFARWPDVDDLVRYACGIEDRLSMLAESLGIAFVHRDKRGWEMRSLESGVRGDDV